MSRTLWSAAIALGLAIGAAGAPPSAVAGEHSFPRTNIGISASGGYVTRVDDDWGHGRRYWDHDRRYWGRGWHGRHYYYHDHHGTGDALLGFMIGALAVGVIAASRNHDHGPAYSYDAPSAPPPALGCHVVNRIGPDRSGRTVKFAATMCYDRAGHPYIAPGTQHIIDRY